MLLDLQRSGLARQLVAVEHAIVDLLAAAAAAPEGAGYEELMTHWLQPRRPSQSSVEDLLALSPEQRGELRDAVAADLAFEGGFDRPGFQFAFPLLDPEARAVGRALLGSMYRVFTKHGFVLPSGERVDRERWEAAFREANPGLRVCPACLIANLDERIGGRSAIDADHYLPKSSYPPLAVNGLNLVPVCKQCNQVAKLEKDPLGTPPDLSSVWFPYKRHGLDELDPGFAPMAGRAAVVRFAAVPGAERRAELFDAVFALSERWSRQLEGIHQSLRREVRLHADQADAEAVRRELETIAEIKEADIANGPAAYVHATYCRWISRTPAALEVLVAEIEDWRRNVTSS